MIPYLLNQMFCVLKFLCGITKLPRYLCDDEIECVICFVESHYDVEKGKTQNIMVITECCKQVFCLECLKTWNHRFRNTCPMCRKHMGYII
jgi:hypothetical protein